MKIVVAIGAFLTVAIGSGMSYAYWTSAGAGSATATVGTMDTVTIESIDGAGTPGSRLYPGGPAAEVLLKVNNPNPFSVEVHAVTANGPADAAGGKGTCTTTGVSFSFPSVDELGATKTLPANSTSVLRLPGAASMSTASQDDCQGATFYIPVTLTVRR